jgi:hypothetical protein
MSYTPTTSPALTLLLIRDTLAALPAWGEVCNGEPALDRIVLGDAGPDPKRPRACSGVQLPALAPPLAVIELISQDDQDQALDDTQRSGSVELNLFLATDGGQPADAYLAAVDRVGGILNGFDAARRNGTCRCAASLTQPPRITAPGAGIPNAFHSAITLTWIIP